MTDHVLIAPGTCAKQGEQIYHVPSEDNPDVPECNNHRAPMTKTWARKDPDVLPTHRACKDCTGQVDRSNPGAKLSWQIQGLWADSEGEA